MAEANTGTPGGLTPLTPRLFMTGLVKTSATVGLAVVVGTCIESVRQIGADPRVVDSFAKRRRTEPNERQGLGPGQRGQGAQHAHADHVDVCVGADVVRMEPVPREGSAWEVVPDRVYEDGLQRCVH